jgi:hypothetical protein
LTIPQLIHPIHHAYQIDQVSFFLFSFHHFSFIYFVFKGNVTAWQYGGSTISPKSSLTILSGSLPSNQTYQFMVIMTNRQNSTFHATGYLLVNVQDSNPQMIVLG